VDINKLKEALEQGLGLNDGFENTEELEDFLGFRGKVQADHMYDIEGTIELSVIRDGGAKLAWSINWLNESTNEEFEEASYITVNDDNYKDRLKDLISPVFVTLG
jgi:hypothetical protein